MWLWLTVKVFLIGCSYFRSINANELDLYKKLLLDYNDQERPVENTNEAVTIQMAIVFQQIIRVDEKNQVVEVNAWLKLSWYDYKLRWEPKKFGGLDRLRFRNEQIWTPDILMYNSAHRKFDAAFPTDVVVNHDGKATWNLPGIFQLSCIINMVWFPFDEQHCLMKFGSWTYDTSKLILTDAGNGSFDLSRYMDNGEWVLKDTSVEQTVRKYSCCAEPYFDLQFRFTLKRRTAAYAFNLIIPCTLITMLTLVGFILPPEAGEKVSYQVSLMLTVCIFQNYVSEMSPPTSEMLPFLGAFFALCMITVSLSVVWTVVVLNLYQRDARTYHMSGTMRKIMLEWLPWLLLMHKPKLLQQNLLLKDHQRRVRQRQKQQEWNEISAELRLYYNNPNLLTLELLSEQVEELNRNLDKKELEKQSEVEWKFTAAVVDRVCLCAFTAFFVLVAVTLLLITPNGA